jgi:single-strand DNA-binding protein
MAGFNKVILLGNLTRDPELRTLPSGAQVAVFGMAMSRKFKSQQGELKEETCFVDIEMFGKLADICGKYLHKGSPVLIEGRLKLDSWEKDGQKRSKLKVVGSGMQLMPKGSRDNAEGGQAADADEGPAETYEAAPGKEDIPF